MSATLSLWDAFAQIPDPREASGRRHPLQAVLTLASVAILSGARSQYAVAQFGRDRGKEFAAALGFTRDVPPCCATLHYLFKGLDREAFEAALRRCGGGRGGGARRPIGRRCTSTARNCGARRGTRCRACACWRPTPTRPRRCSTRSRSTPRPTSIRRR